MGKIVLLGTMDTKEKEYAFIRSCVEASGFETLLIDAGVLGTASLPVHIGNEEVARAGGSSLEQLRSANDRGLAISVMGAGCEAVLTALYSEGQIAGVIALGGTGGTSLACRAMRALPLGIPKVMVTTVAGSDVSGYVGTKDIVMIPSIVDISGINKISREVLARAAGAIAGMARAVVPAGEDKPIIVASMFGNTTVAVEAAKKILEDRGYEVLVFHCTGSGGRTMESLIEAGLAAGVLDITTTELADELAGGVFSAGPNRLGAAAAKGVPAVIAPGCLDMVNFWAPDTVPEPYRSRRLYPHNPNVTLMRTTPEENGKLGLKMAEQLNKSTGPVAVLLPLRGISVISAENQPFHWPEADQRLFAAIKQNLRDDIEAAEVDCNINDAAFAERCAMTLLNMLARSSS